MPDHKHDERFNRQIALFEQKQRIIDLTENHFEVPDVAWDAQPVRYFKLNEQWCKILAGMLDWYEDVAGWKDAEDDNHPGIQAFLEFEVGINGGIFMTPDEFKDNLRDGLYEAFNRLAAQIVSGRYTDIAVDVDGNVSQPSESGGDAGLPDDDPATVIDESLAAKAGGCIAVVAGYNAIWSDMAAWHTAGVDAATAQTRLQAKYQMNDGDLVFQFVDNYYFLWATSHIASYTESILSPMLFCGDGNFKGIVADYIIDNVSATLQENGFKLNAALADSQITAWFDYGQQVPSTIYETYYCTKSPDETLLFDMATANSVQRTSSFVWKKGHRLLVRATGTFSDSDNPTIQADAMWELNTVSNAKTFVPLSFNSGGGTTSPTNIQVPYRSDHVYEFTIEKNPSTGTDATIIISKDNGSYNLPNTIGTLTVELHDLGYFGI